VQNALSLSQSWKELVVERPPSPAARRLTPPSWLNLRTVVGLLLVTGSIAVGARIVAAADRSVQVWALSRDVAAGTVLADGDLRPARVRLFDTTAHYLGTARSPAGRTVERGLHSGELLPVSALRTTKPGVIVNVPVEPQNAPGVVRGQSVDVWAGARGCRPVRVLAGAPVQEVRADGVGPLAGGGGSLQVVVRVSAAEAERLLTAMGPDVTIRLVVLDGESGGQPTADSRPCSSSRPAADGDR
jgi:hypothetical protein